MSSSPPFRPERLIERDALESFIDLYEHGDGRLYRCRFCHLGFSPANDPDAQAKARAHVRTHPGW
jgi:hypothetical protein